MTEEYMCEKTGNKLTVIAQLRGGREVYWGLRCLKYEDKTQQCRLRKVPCETFSKNQRAIYYLAK